MNKKTYKILLIVCTVVFVVGLILTAKNDTPYKVCRMWIAEGPSSSSYAYAVRHIKQHASLYFGGMVIMAGSIITAGVFTVGRFLKKKEKPIKEEIKNSID